MDGLFYTISEASERLNISYRTLHYYEQKFQLKIDRDQSGNRIYSENDLELFDKIIELKSKGMTLEGIKTLFKEKGILKPEDNNNVISVNESTLELKKLLLAEIKTSISQEMKEQFNNAFKESNEKIENVLEDNKQLKEDIRKLQRDSENHYKQLDLKLSDWREKQLAKQKPWYKKLFDKNN